MPAALLADEAIVWKKQQKHQVIRYFFQTGLTELLEKNPVLLRLIASLTRQWIDGAALLINRYFKDHQIIAKHFFSKCGETFQGKKTFSVRVLRVKPYEPNSREPGLSTQILELENSTKITYKDKSCALDYQVSLLVEQLNLCQPPIGLTTLRLLDNEGYAWVEDCAGGADSVAPKKEQFYLRLGAWLALLFLL